MIEIRYLRKEYDKLVALHNLHLNIPTGEVFGLIGPNGAGKTTLIRILATLLEPTYGSVRLFGIDLLADPLKAHPLIGYMSDFFSLYEQMLVWEYLDHFAMCFGIKRQRRSRVLEEVLELVNLEVRRDTPIATLSRGMRQRLCFARTLLTEPKFLLLDEPASGMDPAGRIEFRELIKRLHQFGCTILISSHILTEMTDFCTSIGIMEQGHLVVAGRVADILNQLHTGYTLRLEGQSDSAAIADWLQQVPKVRWVQRRGSVVTGFWEGQRAEFPAFFQLVAQSQLPLASFQAQPDDLEAIYLKIARPTETLEKQTNNSP